MVPTITRPQVLSFRVRAQQLDRESGLAGDTALLNGGVQDTGPDGGLWALVNRGVDTATLGPDELATAWTIRGAPHLYRRADLPSVAAAVWPFSEADAGKRIFDASKPLKEAGIGNLEALEAVATTMRSVVTEPMRKGEVSSRLAALMEEPYLRFCRPCDAIHLYEMPFRLAALPAGLELQAGTSPPVLQRIAGFERVSEVPPRFDVIRTYLAMYGPATPQQVAGYLDAAVKDVKARWPDDVTEVTVEGETRWLLSSDVDALDAGPVGAVRLLGPYDAYLQAKDRSLLVDDPARAKALWPVLGRPGAVLVDGEIAGMWRPRKSGTKLELSIELWESLPAHVREAIAVEAERLAAFRQVRLAGVHGVDG
ncbi:winged helix DNA-binding domain-containing protein [Actinobacteria bacterium YIM 96077]|uniref:Winged helix DNA-binding domain-containing protein n=1 Tax=Phytoactinopolyspora halophila TaxID=1981511 RepID=A0A329QUD7_9ACTN|nr:winged helix DNA-binding domain-containing protein [Phytoactinopolyspora halophila]AYY13820.1 winged helix DNA-binding domain-containing protein [Actinobacteria bacterium YIM 96077]RAW15636.1 winged helix DNA-binding domain-containing protein [Phytoactinopolyspora halophila]